LSEEIISKDSQAVIHKVHRHRNPQAARPNKDISEHGPHQHTRYKTIELHMDGGEDKRRNPDSHVYLCTWYLVTLSLTDDLLERAAEG